LVGVVVTREATAGATVVEEAEEGMVAAEEVVLGTEDAVEVEATEAEVCYPCIFFCLLVKDYDQFVLIVALTQARRGKRLLPPDAALSQRDLQKGADTHTYTQAYLKLFVCALSL
jgi:hypothetical protein